jgi:D-glycero-D-manno-heptose 1,7-bisphosphate phosphatase
MTIKTIFLDRDGVINKDKNYVYKVEDFEFIDGVFTACKYLLAQNYKIIIVTNQSGIGRGYYSEKDFDNINAWMLKQFRKNDVNILDVFHCPHIPEANCNCRKPKPGMFHEAKNKHSIDLEKSWMIGDSERDITAANLAGIKNTILVNSRNKIEKKSSNAVFFLDSIQESKYCILE